MTNPHTGLHHCEAAIPCGAVLETDGNSIPTGGAIRCRGCHAEVCQSHAIRSKDGYCATCAGPNASLSVDEAVAIARGLVNLDGLAARDGWLGLQKVCPHPEDRRAAFIGLRIECGLCGVSFGNIGKTTPSKPIPSTHLGQVLGR